MGLTPWVIGTLALAIFGASKKSDKAKGSIPGSATPPQPVVPVAPPKDVSEAPPNMPLVPIPPPVIVSPGIPQAPVVTRKPKEKEPVPVVKLPPFVPPDAKPIEEVIPVPPPGTLPKPIEDVVPVNPIPVKPIPVKAVPIDIMPPIARPPVIDLDDVRDVPPDAVPIAPPHKEPTDLATQVYRITQGKIRQLKGSEVKAIKAFQTDVGLKADGFYGPDTAEELIQYGFVPSIPWIWPSGITKAKWNDLMRDHAVVDPQRADEWLSKLAK